LSALRTLKCVHVQELLRVSLPTCVSLLLLDTLLIYPEGFERTTSTDFLRHINYLCLARMWHTSCSHSRCHFDTPFQGAQGEFHILEDVETKATTYFVIEVHQSVGSSLALPVSIAYNPCQLEGSPAKSLLTKFK
jgi:hypothetical protein